MNPHNRDLLSLRSQKPVATHFPLLKLWTNCRGVTGSSFLHFILVRRYLWEWMGPCSIQGKVKVTLFIHSSGTDLFYFHFWALPCKGCRTCTFVWRLSFGECFFLNLPALEKKFGFTFPTWLCCDFQKVSFSLKKSIVTFLCSIQFFRHNITLVLCMLIF